MFIHHVIQTGQGRGAWPWRTPTSLPVWPARRLAARPWPCFKKGPVSWMIAARACCAVRTWRPPR